MKLSRILVVVILLTAFLVPIVTSAGPKMAVRTGRGDYNYTALALRGITFTNNGGNYTMQVAYQGGVHPYPVADIQKVFFYEVGTGVGAESGSLLPTKLHITGNYPNPFNGSTEIRYVVDRSGLVKLAVIDLTGREVASLVSDTQAAGSYQARWDGRDARGASVPTGVYLARLETGGAVEARQMLLLK